ncbi:MAG: hypothetical protein EHM23_17185 [Acidobacteria bacterium]|nr:MAG: hypothetical protein EHM23_17185 [Acidobacteriota bacterium]
MSQKRMTLIGLAVVALLAFSVTVWAQDTQAQQPQAQQAQPSPQSQEGTLKLTVKYNGTEGAVDQTHKLLVFVFDSPNIGTGDTIPIKFDGLAENGGTLTMPFTVTPVYVAVVYDKTGGYDFTAPPASGSPATIYMKDGQGPAPIAIEPGKTTEIDLQFDDSIRVP